MSAFNLIQSLTKHFLNFNVNVSLLYFYFDRPLTIIFKIQSNYIIKKKSQTAKQEINGKGYNDTMFYFN